MKPEFGSPEVLSTHESSQNTRRADAADDGARAERTTEESRGPIAAVRSPATERLPVGEHAELLALLRRALEALPHPSAGRKLVLDAVRRLEATAADAADDAAG